MANINLEPTFVIWNSNSLGIMVFGVIVKFGTRIIWALVSVVAFRQTPWYGLERVWRITVSMIIVL